MGLGTYSRPERLAGEGLDPVTVKLCNGCGCRYQPYRNSRGRCRDCLREYEREKRQRRGSTAQRGYGRAWQERGLLDAYDGVRGLSVDSGT